MNIGRLAVGALLSLAIAATGAAALTLTACAPEDGEKSEVQVTKGLAYSLLADGTYEVSMGSATGENIVIPSTYKGRAVTAIAEAGFQNCKDIEKITIPDGVTAIGNNAFDSCHALESVYLPDSMTTIGDDAFNYCLSLRNIVIPDSVTTIGDMAFRYCSSLTSVNIPDGVTTIGDQAFYGCASLKSVVIPDSVTSIGDVAFFGCYELKIVEIPGSIKTIEPHAFQGCTSLASVIISDGVTTIGDGAFYYCISLKDIEIPDSVTTIGNNAFQSCTSLEQVDIPDSVTAIGWDAFYGCTSLESIVIPESVTTIGEGAFNACTSLTIYCKAESRPDGWEDGWNGGRRAVFGYGQQEPAMQIVLSYNVGMYSGHRVDYVHRTDVLVGQATVDLEVGGIYISRLPDASWLYIVWTDDDNFVLLSQAYEQQLITKDDLMQIAIKETDNGEVILKEHTVGEYREFGGTTNVVGLVCEDELVGATEVNYFVDGVYIGTLPDPSWHYVVHMQDGSSLDLEDAYGQGIVSRYTLISIANDEHIYVQYGRQGDNTP